MTTRSMATRLGLRGTGARLPAPQRALRQALIALADRSSLFLVRGLHDPYRPIDHRAFMRGTPWAMHLDYVTHAGTELICREIHERAIEGAIAELGVASGLWARTANRHLPDRLMYLFDTFSGFDPRDLASDAEAGLGDEPPYLMSPVSVDAVIRVLPDPERAVFRVGWFPESAAGLEGVRFALVHIDVGVMSATLEGLRYFHPRLAPGGTIIIEDYNNRHAPGVRRAVDQFLAGISVATTVWPNRGGALLIIAPPADAAEPLPSSAA